MTRPLLHILSIFIIATITSCQHDPVSTIQPPVTGNFPEVVGRIFQTRCATAGCHNAASYENASGLKIDSWEALFAGGNSGAVAVPYSPTYSSLLYFINTHADLGPIAQPTMPLYETPLSRDEYLIIANWIAAGAPSASGEIPFAAGEATKQKIYITQQGCDLVAVVDATTRQVMRYIQIGASNEVESPHCVRFSNDGTYAYASFTGGTNFQKIDATKDSVVGSVDMGQGKWNVFQLSPDGKQALVSDWSGNGKALLINTVDMTITGLYDGFIYPHGVASNKDFNIFYLTGQSGNTIYKFSIDGAIDEKVSLDGMPPSTLDGTRDPHEIMMTPDYSKYIVTCEASNEVRIMDATADTCIKAIPVGIFPQEIALSHTKPLAFITCKEDNSTQSGYKGSVYVINYNTYGVTRIDGPFYQPHGITVDDKNGVFYVVSENANPNGPAPHHASSCNGRNGYYNVYDLNTLQRLPKRYEVTVDPYSADTRFK